MNNTHEEFWWNTKSQNTINVSPHDFKMHKSLEKLSKIEEASV